MSLTTDLNDSLALQAQSSWQNILERAEGETKAALLDQVVDPSIARQLGRVLACSPFVSQTARSRPTVLLDLLQSGS